MSAARIPAVMACSEAATKPASIRRGITIWLRNEWQRCRRLNSDSRRFQSPPDASSQQAFPDWDVFESIRRGTGRILCLERPIGPSRVTQRNCTRRRFVEVERRQVLRTRESVLFHLALTRGASHEVPHLYW